MTQRAIVNTAYLAPVQYYSKYFLYDEIFIEQFDSYSKQTYRNRCRILGANGLLNLTVPVLKDSGKKKLTKDIQIDYSTKWQKNHWRSIFSAYNSSPFFEFFADDFIPLYEKKETFLIDFNHKFHHIISELIELGKEPKYSSTFEKEFEGTDYRNIITPKKQYQQYDSSFYPVQYTQTFDEKFDFHPNLSIIDLLFNKGPESEEILRNCNKK